MTQRFQVHPQNPQPRLLKQAVELLNKGGVIAVPTDSCYALVCHLDDKAAAEQLRRLRGLDEDHPLTLLCRDLQELGRYAIANNVQYRLLKSALPGPYTFVLEATKEVPRRVSHPKRKTIGLRVPNNPVILGLLELHEGPLLATTCIPPDQADALNDAEEIEAQFGRQLAAVIDAGACTQEPTTVIDLSQDTPLILRRGAGDPAELGLLQN